MGAGVHRRIASLAILTLLAAGCGKHEQNALPPQSDMYDSNPPGQIVTPTHDSSFHLLGEDGPTRFAELQQLMVAKGQRCAAVTKAVILGGLDGTDEWRVTCSDSGAWQLWFKNDGDIELDHCTDPKCA